VYVYGSPSVLVASQIYDNVAGTSGSGAEGGGIALSGSSATLVGNTIRDNQAGTTMSGLGGGVYVEDGHSYFINNYLLGNVSSPDGSGGGGGIWFGLEDQSLLWNTVIVDNAIGDMAQGAGVAVEWSYPCFEHTTLHDNTGGTGTGLEAWFGSSVVMSNTIVTSQSVGVFADAGDTVTLDNVLWFANGADTGGGGSLVINNAYHGNPAFLADGYHLGPGSAAADAGFDAGLGYDIDGQDRPSGAGFDLGADEWVVVSGTVGPAVGATLIYTDGGGTTTTVEIPAGVVNFPVSVVYSPILSPTHALPSNLRGTSHNFYLDVYSGTQLLPGFAFLEPIKLSVTYASTQVAYIDEDTLGFYYWSGSSWVDGSTTCTPPSSYIRDPALNTLSLEICHLSQWNMSGEPAPLISHAVYLPLVTRATSGGR
jgi:hypothetical protein